MVMIVLSVAVIIIISLILPLFLIINGFVMLKKEGHRLQNMLSLCTGVLMIAGTIIPVLCLYYFENKVILDLIMLVLILEFYVAYTFAALFIYSVVYAFIPKKIKCDYIIVHGCGLLNGERVSPLLRGRIDKAVKVYDKCKIKPKIVVSGGKGADEKISEAEAMKKYLLETGFSEENIIMEDKSATTFQNLENVKKMLDKDGIKHRYIFVTNNYHVFRTSLFAKKLKMKAKGVGCKTAGYYWPSAFIREYIAIILKYKWIMIALVILYALGIVVSY